jgi:hypothetical protein
MSASALVESYFDPEDDLESRVAEEIGRAKHSVWIQAYKFSSERIVDTILRLQRENPGLDVRLALDPKEASSGREKRQGRLVAAIAEAGGEVRLVADADKSHSKFIIIDTAVVLTGSFNFKRHAARVQQDNMVVIRSRDVARTYATRFQETLTSDHVLTAQEPTNRAEPDPFAMSPGGHPPEVDSEAGGAPAETATATPAAWRRWGGWLLESGRTLVLGFSRPDRILIGSHILPRLGTHRGSTTPATDRPDASPPLRPGTNARTAAVGLKWSLSIGTAALMLLGIVGIGRFEQMLEADAEFEFSGIVEALPPDGLVGTWLIGGRVVQVTESTEIERTSSLPAIGTLVAVEGTVLADQSINALEIELGDDKN